MVKRITINHKPYPYAKDSTILVDFSRKNLSIEFYPLTGDSAQMAYRLLNLDTTWQVSSYPVFNLYGLSGGDYILEVREVKPASRGGAPQGQYIQGSGIRGPAIRKTREQLPGERQSEAGFPEAGFPEAGSPEGRPAEVSLQETATRPPGAGPPEDQGAASGGKENRGSPAAVPGSAALSVTGTDALRGSSAAADAVLRIPIRVQEAFWQKWWFWPSVILYFLLLLGVGVYLFFLYDFRQKLKLHYVRNRIASDLHDEVGSNLNSIAIFTELLRKKVADDASLLPILDRITSNSEETVTLMRDTVWAINPENDSTEKLVERMRAFGVEILAAKDIPFQFTVHDLKNSDGLSMEQRRSLYLVYKEAVNNIAKHSEAKNAACTVKKEEGVLKVLIKDDGKGFDPDATFEGNGLRNFATRGREENMHVSVTSKPGEGTTVAVEVWI